MRILVTGSRNWPFPEMIKQAIGQLNNEDNTLVVGACPTGADKMAEDMWVGPIERHPANWKKYGLRAGPIRNAEMVKSEIDVCFGFILDNSKGALGTVNLAFAEGIETIVTAISSRDMGEK